MCGCVYFQGSFYPFYLLGSRHFFLPTYDDTSSSLSLTTSNHHTRRQSRLLTMEKRELEKLESVELEEVRQSRDLPSPATAQQPRNRAKFSAATIIPVWIALSSGVIIYNNYIYNTLNFKFPVFLVTWHLTFAVSFLYLLILY